MDTIARSLTEMATKKPFAPCVCPSLDSSVNLKHTFWYFHFYEVSRVSPLGFGFWIRLKPAVEEVDDFVLFAELNEFPAS